MVPSKSDLVNSIIDKMHLGIENGIGMLKRQQIALVDGVIMFGLISRKGAGLEIFGDGLGLGGVHDERKVLEQPSL